MPTESRDPYAVATTRLRAEGFALNARTCFYERGFERLKLRWNGKVYARRRGPDAPDLSLAVLEQIDIQSCDPPPL